MMSRQVAIVFLCDVASELRGFVASTCLWLLIFNLFFFFNRGYTRSCVCIYANVCVYSCLGVRLSLHIYTRTLDEANKLYVCISKYSRRILPRILFCLRPIYRGSFKNCSLLVPTSMVIGRHWWGLIPAKAVYKDNFPIGIPIPHAP